MAESQDVRQRFLDALTQYVDFRLSAKFPVEDVPPKFTRFVGLFEEFLRSRNGNPESKAFQALMQNMTRMKESRGTGTPPPNSEPTDI